MIYYVDIDETICRYEGERNYPDALPIEKNIEKINDLYDSGNTVVYWTARGTTTGIDWRDVTERQFSKWGVKYHELKFGKPNYDLFIDDKNIGSERFFSENHNVR
jgi:CMP-N,N'-diacetyllegionaminic acid synthase